MKKNSFVILLLFLAGTAHAGQKTVSIPREKIPTITSLDSYNPVFIQYSEEVENAYKNFAAGKKNVQNFYRYVVEKNDTLFQIAARCSVPYETVATLNNITDTAELTAGSELVLPVVAGIFIADKPKSNIEILLRNKYAFRFEDSQFMLYNYNGRIYCFLENVRFDSTVRAFFLDSEMKLPVAHGILTSPYGMRESPFTGKMSFHKGIDLAVPVGTAVLACKHGVVIAAVKNNSVFGNYVILKHDNGMTSVYAHLSRILVKKGQAVYGGNELGLSGNSGESTGPHLHFEVRINGIAKNPANLLPLEQHTTK
ncbi:MAG: M23 family metallopeptidase [Treponema sp.]|nr:M23 family metallopeptidase [Treponema sp.]